MNTDRNYGHNNLQNRNTTITGSRKSSNRMFFTINAVFANCSDQELNQISRINLQDCYENNARERVNRCLLCKVNINENDTFEHTRSTTHDYNKLFHNFVKKRNMNGDMDFIRLNAKWVQCRYCDDVRFARGFHQLEVDHNQSIMHLERKEYCLNRITGGANKVAVPQKSRNTPNPCVATVAERIERECSRVGYERQSVVGPSRELKETKIRAGDQIQEMKNLERNSYGFNKITDNGKKIAVPQRLPSAPNSPTKSMSPIQSPTVSNTHQLGVGPSRKLEETKRSVNNQIQDIKDLEENAQNPCTTMAESLKRESSIRSRHQLLAERSRKFFGFTSKERNSKSGLPTKSGRRLKKMCIIC